MRWTHPDWPDRAVRLAYCLNLHPAENLEGFLEGLRRFAIPLKTRLECTDSFGVGPWLPASLAIDLEHGNDSEILIGFLREHDLDAFTWNAFPYGGFHQPGLKQGVFAPTWAEDERVEFTLAVARLAAAADASGGGGDGRHLSISTHTGKFGSASEEEQRAFARNLDRCSAELRLLQERTGQWIVLSLEAEPRSSSGDNAALSGFLERARSWSEDPNRFGNHISTLR